MTRLFTDRPYIVAEIGSNWRTLDDCLESIRVAKECGASAAKFQLFTPESLYGFWDPVPKTGETSQLNAGKHALPLDWLPQLSLACRARDLEFMCTAFSPELVADVDAYVSVHKVASSDCCWPQMLDAVAKTGKPVLISTGATTEDDRNAIWDWHEASLAMRDRRREHSVVWMACTATYPADYTPASCLAVRHGGLSDHTLGYNACVEAVRNGAIVIEKHFTAFPDLDTPDRPHSLTPDQFKAMVHLIRTGEAPDQEREFRLKHKRRLIATTDIPPGGILRYGESFGAYRSLEPDTRGLSPFRWEEVEGKTATKEIKRGSPIGEGDYG